MSCVNVVMNMCGCYVEQVWMLYRCCVCVMWNTYGLKLLVYRELFLNNNRLGKISAYAFYSLRIEHLYLDGNRKLLIDIRELV